MLESRRLFSVAAIDDDPDGGGDPPPEVFPDVLEENDTFAEATPLGTTNSVNQSGLTIDDAEGADVDFFKFTAAGTGAVGVKITFSNNEGNLRLDAYDGNRVLLKSSNTSSTLNAFEQFALSVTAGQTYYIKVAGSNLLQTSPSYGLTVRPASVQFDWTMNKRTGDQLDQWGLPIIPNTRDYARPNVTVINGVEVPQFPVRFSAQGSYLPPGGDYSWHVVGSGVDRTLAGGPALTENLPEGTYTVTLTGTAEGQSISTAPQTVKVVDHLIVAMGDSYGSGEGNPHQGQQYDFLGFTTSGAKWAQGLDGGTTAAHRRAHRSSYAGVVQAAVDLENSDPKSSVTLVFLDHTGATIDTLLGTNGARQPSGDPGEAGDDPAQFDQMDAMIGNRRIDAMVLSVGGNDAGFLELGARIVEADPEKDGGNYQHKLDQIWADAVTFRNRLSTRYAQLANRVRQYDVGQVFLTEYPDPTRDSSGNFAGKILDDIGPGYEADRNELTQTYDKILVPLGQAMARAAVENKWTYVSDIASQFRTHGYGDWFRTASDSIIAQGPLGNKFDPLADKTKTTGMLHPTADGQQVYRNRLDDVFHQADLVTTGFALTDNAFLPNAADGYVVTIVNRSLTTAAPASMGTIYVSPDWKVDKTDFAAFNFSVPALGPGESVTLSGALLPATDPFRTFDNFDVVAPVLDVNNQVAESDELNNYSVGAIDPVSGWRDLALIRSDRDFIMPELNMLATGTPVTAGQSVRASIGLDEFAGPYDMDVYTFDAAAGQRLAFDIDNDASSSFLNTVIRLYPMSGSWINTGALLASNDHGRAPGEGQGENGESYLTHTFAAAGKYCLVVSHAVNGAVSPNDMLGRQAGPMGTYTLSVSVAPEAPTVNAITVNDGGAQRSRVASITVTFNQPVDLAQSPVTLQRLNTGGSGKNDGSAPTPANDAIASITSPDGGTTWVFTFGGTSSFVQNGSLADGTYTLTVDKDKVTTNGVPMQQGAALTFHRLFGDTDGNKSVNTLDYGRFRNAFGRSTGQPGYDAAFDFDGNGTVNTLDYGQFRSRYGKLLTY